MRSEHFQDKLHDLGMNMIYLQDFSHQMKMLIWRGNLWVFFMRRREIFQGIDMILKEHED